MMYDVAIVGAGASGMACAVTAANRGLTVLVLDKNIQPGKKLRATGNGRCNIANRYFDNICYRGNHRDQIQKWMQPDSYKKCLDFFRGLGLAVTEKNGYFYPASMQAASVINLLNRAMEHAGVTCCYGRQVTGIRCKDGKYCISAVLSKEYVKEASRAAKKNKKAATEAKQNLFAVTGKQHGIRTADGSDTFVYEARNLVLATGGFAGPQYGCSGDGYTFAGDFGHHIVETLPALVPLLSDESFCGALSGVRVSGQAAIYIDGKRLHSTAGEIQFTDYGISGICVFEISRFAAKALAMNRSVVLRLNFMPEHQNLSSADVLEQLFGSTEYLSVLDSLSGLVPEKLARVILVRADVDVVLKAGHLDTEQKRRILEQLEGFELHITGCKDYDMAQVTAGGVSLDEVTTNFQSGIQDRLYLVGELLDVDGTCGGYNLTFAFLSGIAAGEGVHI